MVATGESKAQLLLDMLVEGEMLTAEQRDRIVALEGQDNRSTLQIIDDERMVDPEQLVVAAGLFLGVPFVNLKRQEIEEEAIQVVPEWICRKFGVVPIRVREGTVHIAMADPSDLQQVDEISATLRKPVEAALAMHRDIDEAIDRHYRIGGDIASELRRVQAVAAGPSAKAGDEATAEAIAEAPVVRAIDLLIRHAARDRASDITNRQEARILGHAVDVDPAVAALANPAAVLRAGQADDIPNDPEQGHFGRYIDAIRCAVDCERNCHNCPLPWPTVTRLKSMLNFPDDLPDDLAFKIAEKNIIFLYRVKVLKALKAPCCLRRVGERCCRLMAPSGR